MWIGQYAEPSVKLKGAPVDATMARAMARRLGVTPGQLLEFHDQQLTLQGMRQAWATLQERIQPGDNVFIYFSGHGAQRSKADGSGCSEGLVTHDGRMYFDVQLRGQLEQLAQKATRVWMFNDACHAGGAVSKALAVGAPQTKVYPLPLVDDDEAPRTKSNSATSPDRDHTESGWHCGVPVNVAKTFRGFDQQARADTQALYLAAAADNEAAFGTEEGSAATRGWAACLSSGKPHTGDSLARCAQQWMQTNLPQFKQTITVRLNGQLPLPPR